MRLFSIYTGIFLALLSCRSPSHEYKTWSTYRGTPDAMQFSALKQIDTNNVHLLEPAWTYRTGDAGERTTIECNPIVVNDIMYITSPRLKLIALNATTGEELWCFDPEDNQAGGVNRGVAYWTDGKTKSILFSRGIWLYSVNALTGALNTSFGNKGKIDLRQNLDANPDSITVTMSSPGVIYNDLYIIGSATGEGYDAAPGHIRAYHAGTGEFQWIFHTIPKEGEFGYDTWQWIEGENYGGANNWSGLSLDEERGWVFVATGSASYDFYGANRIGKNLFANCVIALDALTGERIWHYQAVHHDLWDYDLTSAPNLVTIPFKGKMIDVAIQTTKMGTLIILDRETGQPLIDAPELPVPPSDVPGEVAFTTQRVDQGIIITPQGLTEDYLTNISEESHTYALREFKKYRNGPMYTPPSIQGTLTFPATRGGMLWGGTSVDPENNFLYVSANELPMILQVARVEPEEGKTKNPGQKTYLLNCSNCHGTDGQGTPDFPGLDNLPKKYSREELSAVITRGKGQMPAYTHFNDREMNELMDYLLNIETKGSVNVDENNRMDKYVLQGFRLFLDQDGFPASKPPWATLNALDLQTMEIVWKVPLGFYPELAERGIKNTGTQTFGGCVATAGGLVFIGATADERFRAFHARTGEELWSFKLSAGGYATPAVYEIKGKQYVVIAAGGGNRNGTPSGDSFYAFSLPD